MSLIEIYNIIFQILFIFLILSLPLFPVGTNNKIKVLDFSLIDKFTINLIILVNIFLFASLLSIQGRYILFLYLIFIIFLLLFKFYRFRIKKFEINFYFLTLLLFIFLISIDIAYKLDLGWDVKWFWFFKTLNFYQDQNFENLKNFPIQDYPHLGTYIWSFFWKFPINEFEYLGRISYAVIYTISIFSISECLKTNLHIKIIFSILTIFLTYNYELFSGLQEVLVFSFILIASKFAYYFLSENKNIKTEFLIYILLGISNILCWIKPESLFFIFFFILSLLLIKSLEIKRKIFFGGALLAIIFFRIFIFALFEIEHNPGYEFEKTFSIGFIELIKKLKIISFYLIVYLTQNPIYFVTIPILIVLIYKYKMNDITKFTLYFMVLNFSFLYLAYLFKIDDVETQVRHSMKRFIFETSGFYFLSIISLINNYTNSLNLKIFSNFKIRKY